MKPLYNLTCLRNNSEDYAKPWTDCGLMRISWFLIVTLEQLPSGRNFCEACHTFIL